MPIDAPSEGVEFDTCEEFGEFFRVSSHSVRRRIRKKEVFALRFGKTYRIPRTERIRLLQEARPSEGEVKAEG
jgi:hypothetical protein